MGCRSITAPRGPVFALAVLCALAAFPAGAAKARVALRWEPVPGASAYELEIARDRAFTDVVVKEQVPVAGYRWENVPTTPHFWRVRSLDKDGRAGPWSDAREISPKVPPPAITGPADGLRLPCLPSCTLAVTFEPQTVLQSYVVEVSESADFAHAKRFSAAEPPVKAELTGPGTWYFRLLAIDVANRETEPTEARRAIGFPPPPAPLAPDVSAVLPFDAAVPTKFSWSAPDAYTRFEVEWRKGKEPPKQAAVSARNTSQPLDAPGDWSWRVRAVLDGDQRTEWSPWTAFTLAPGAPALASPDDGARFSTRAGKKELTLKWTGAAAAFAVQTSPTPDFTDVEELPATCCEARVARAPGTWFWRVVPRDDRGNRGAPSEPRSLVISTLPPLAPPQLASPGDADSVRAGSVSFAWAPVPDAVAYELRVARSTATPGTTTTAAPVRVEATTASLDLPDEGTYTAQLRGLDADEGAGPWSEPRLFFVGPPPTARLERVGEWPALTAGEESEVALALLDARGRRIRNAPVVFRYGDAVITPEETGDGTYVFRVRPPQGVSTPREDAIAVVDRGFSSQEPVRVEPRAGPFRLSAQLGVANNLGAATAPYVGADGYYRLPVLAGHLGVGVRAGTWGGTLRVHPAGADGFSADVAYRVTPVALTVSYLHRLRGFDLRGGVGAGVNAFWVDALDEANGGMSGLAQAFIGAGRQVGPGVLAIDASLGMGRGDQSFARLRTGAAVVVLSYGVAP